HISERIERNTLGTAQASQHCQAAVTAECSGTCGAGSTRTGNRGDDAGVLVDLADPLSSGVGKVQAAVGTKRKPTGTSAALTNVGQSGRAAVAIIPLVGGEAGIKGNHAGGVNFVNASLLPVADV